MAASLTGEPRPSSSLKRKRPPRLDIPNVLREILTDTPKPRNDAGESFSGAGVGLFSRKGKKKKFMEDSHKIVSLSPTSSVSNRRFFGVYDGHGGKKAAEFVTENLHRNVLEMMANCTGTKEEAIRSAYLKTDQDFLNQGLCSGSCCVTAVIEGPEIAVSNLGDCRAVLSRGGVAEALTKDHRAENKDERKRIEDNGGYVDIHRGAWRIHSTLIVSRSIGDARLKEWVLGEPETKILQLTPDMEFLVLASDGLWDQVGNQEAVDTIKRLNSAEKKLGNCSKENSYNIDVGSVNISPSPKIRRVSIVKTPKGNHSPKDSENNFFSSENENPPSKTRRLSLVKRVKTKIEESPKDDDACNYVKTPDYGVLVGACKELANLAVARGGLDDITVMVIDLNHFRLNS